MVWVIFPNFIKLVFTKVVFFTLLKKNAVMSVLLKFKNIPSSLKSKTFEFGTVIYNSFGTTPK